jgi:hypothetical protein
MLFSDAMSGSVWIRTGSRMEPLRSLPESTTKMVPVWGIVGVPATTPVIAPIFHRSHVGQHDMTKIDVIKCNHFPAQSPTSTLNTARLTPPHPALPRTHVIKIGPKTHHLPPKLLHQRTYVIILPTPLPSTVYRPPSTIPPNFMEFDTLASIITLTPASAARAAGSLLAPRPRGTKKP